MSFAMHAASTHSSQEQIAVFFVVSQLVAFFTAGERPSQSLSIGGAFIILGGLIIYAGRP